MYAGRGRLAGAFGALLRAVPAYLAAFLLLLSCGSRQLVTGDEIFDLERQTLDMVNGYRIGFGMIDLRWDESLAEIARAHARSMASGSRWTSHRCFEYRSLLAASMMGEGNLWENVGSVLESDRPVADIITGWRNSAPHRNAMLCSATLSGVGAARGDNGELYVVQLFYQKTMEPNMGLVVRTLGGAFH